jgi:hypothetical protein
VLGQRLGEVRAATGEASLDSYARSVMEHTAEGMEQDIRWIDRLIDAERSQISVGTGAKSPDWSGTRRGGERP